MLSSFQFDDEFNLFPKLPIELRSVIWKLALPKPRIITISTQTRFRPRCPFRERRSFRHPECFKPVSNAAPIPCGDFQTSRESRDISLKVYSPAFAERLGKPIYFDWLYDTLYFDSFWGMYHFCATSQRLCLPINYPIPASVPEWQSKIRHLAGCYNWMMNDTFLKTLTKFPKLESYTTEATPEFAEGWSREQILGVNDECKSRLYGLWKKDLGVADESKLPQIIFLNQDEMARKMTREKVNPLPLCC